MNADNLDKPANEHEEVEAPLPLPIVQQQPPPGTLLGVSVKTDNTDEDTSRGANKPNTKERINH